MNEMQAHPEREEEEYRPKSEAACAGSSGEFGFLPRAVCGRRGASLNQGPVSTWHHVGPRPQLLPCLRPHIRTLHHCSQGDVGRGS